MDNAKLLENTSLCYLPLSSLQEWLKNNNLLNKNFAETKKQWKNLSPFFIDTKLLVSEQDIILLQVEDENVAEYLAKTYQIKEQQVCQELFGENKNFILLTKRQWESLSNEKVREKGLESCLVLFKDEDAIKNKLTKWLEYLPQVSKQN